MTGQSKRDGDEDSRQAARIYHRSLQREEEKNDEYLSARKAICYPIVGHVLGIPQPAELRSVVCLPRSLTSK